MRQHLLVLDAARLIRTTLLGTPIMNEHAYTFLLFQAGKLVSVAMTDNRDDALVVFSDQTGLPLSWLLLQVSTAQTWKMLVVSNYTGKVAWFGSLEEVPCAEA